MSFIIAIAAALANCVILVLLQSRKQLALSLNLLALALGATAALLGIFLRNMGIEMKIIGGVDPVMTLFYALFAVGLSTELIAFVALRYLFYSKKAFSEPLSGVYFAAWIAMGGVFVESLFWQDLPPWLPIINWLGHLSLAIILGYFVGMAKFAADERQNFVYLNSGLGAAIIVQGLHEFFIWQQHFHNVLVLVLGSTFMAMVLVSYLRRQEKEQQQSEKHQSKLEELYAEKEHHDD